MSAESLPRRHTAHGTVYALLDPRTAEIRYVGKTVVKPRDRLRRHVRDAFNYESQFHCARWIRSLGDCVEPRMVVLQECERERTSDVERYWIANLREVGCHLTNHTEGGDGMLGRSPSAETRAKIGAAHRGKIVSAETRAKISAARLDPSAPKSKLRPRKTPEEIAAQTSKRMKEMWNTRREEMSAYQQAAATAMKGSTPSPETNQKRAESMRERWKDEEFRASTSEKISAARRSCSCGKCEKCMKNAFQRQQYKTTKARPTASPN